jgi:MoaA/NifB/PqqE/SkfB family radical SAM enzyme
MGPSGVHLFNRETGLNFLLDEVIVPPHLWSTAPRQISIALTNVCDLKCPYCYAPKNSDALDPEQVKLWLNELDEHGCLGVGFGGGEPTLYRQFAELCSYAAQNTRLAVTFTTHAHRLDETLVSRLTGSVHFIRVSVDGVGNTYEQLRGRSFAKLCERLGVIRTLAPFGINYVVNAQTVLDLDAALELAENAGASEFLLLPEQPVRGRGGIDLLTMEALRQWSARYCGKLPLTISEVNAEGFPVCNPLIQETGLRAYAHIDASGVLKSSSYSNHGILISGEGVIHALLTLRKHLEVQ